MVGSGFWRLVFIVAGNGALVQAGKEICYVNYVPNKYEMSDYKKAYHGKVSDTMKWFKDYPISLAQVDPLLEKITTPTKIFWGHDDAILYKDNGERLHKRMPNSELQIFENCGHFFKTPNDKIECTYLNHNKASFLNINTCLYSSLRSC